MTGVLRLLTTGVAFVGVLSALTALGLERGRELAMLRAQGLAPPALDPGDRADRLMGLCAGLIAVPVGLVEGLVLVRVISRHAFGWSLETELDAGVLGQALLLAVGAALLARRPALRMPRTPAAAGLREE